MPVDDVKFYKTILIGSGAILFVLAVMPIVALTFLP